MGAADLWHEGKDSSSLFLDSLVLHRSHTSYQGARLATDLLRDTINERDQPCCFIPIGSLPVA
jgi:hypothetical protein